MIRALIGWAVHNPLIVMLGAAVLTVGGTFALLNVNIEAYPDPAPAIIEVIAQYPGVSAEDVEQRVTIPLEVALAGMPGLTHTRSKSLFGLSHIRNQFDYGVDFERAKQDVLNRLPQAQKDLPAGVVPDISPTSPTGEIFRYSLRSPLDKDGKEIYSLNDLKAIEDWMLEREFKRIPRIADVVSFGGTVKRYEIQPNPLKMALAGVTLAGLQQAIADSNQNYSGDVQTRGDTAQVIRALGLLGGGKDPIQQALLIPPPTDLLAPETRQRLHAQNVAKFLTDEEDRRRKEIREIVINSADNRAIRIGNLVDDDLYVDGKLVERRGVLVSHQTRQGRVSITRPEIVDGKVQWIDRDDIVQGIVLLRKGYESLPALKQVKEKVKQLNETPGKLPPGVKIEPYYDRTDLMNLTTETVFENVTIGLALVAIILLMFLNNIRTTIIVAINIPLALLFAFSVLYIRGRSANLLSIGAVDFGIIVDSTVIMVENIYRHLSSDESSDLPFRERLLKAALEMQKSLFFSTVIMVCALLPLFVMKGPEGQIFGPMADTYAFALGGALLLALTVSPALCFLMFRHLKPRRPNFLVRGLKSFYLWQLQIVLRLRWLMLAMFVVFTLLTLGLILPQLGQEFMPELEEGSLWVRGTFPVSISLERQAQNARKVRAIFSRYPEMEAVVVQLGRPDDGTDPTGFYNLEAFAPLRPQKDWPVPEGRSQRRTKDELSKELNNELQASFPGVDWGFSQYIRDNVMEALSGVKGENSVKIFGPDLDELERLAERVKLAMSTVPGVDNPGVFRIKGQTNLELPIDREKSAAWGIRTAEIGNVIETAVGGKKCSDMIQGKMKFDITLRWPLRWRQPRWDDQNGGLLDIPVDVMNNSVTPFGPPTTLASPVASPATGVSQTGSSRPPATLTGSANTGSLPVIQQPHRRLGDLVTPGLEQGKPHADGLFEKSAASTIYREQNERFIAVKFGVRGRDLAGTVAEAQQKVKEIVLPPYRTVWSGEFEEMEAAERRLVEWFSLSLVLILALLYIAFRSILDVLLVFANVLAVSLGGIWALWLTGLNINISALVGFISILGVAVMNGLILVSSFNSQRAFGVPLEEAIRNALDHRVRPLMMTLLTAILGLLPAAFSTKIGAQSQRPLAIVVVGGMCMTLLLINLVPLLYSFYGHREPPEGAAGMAH